MLCASAPRSASAPIGDLAQIDDRGDGDAGIRQVDRATA